MSIDLSGGLPPEREYFFAERPGPEVRDAVNIWLEDEDGAVAMRIGFESVAEEWEMPELWLDIAYPDGRVLSARERGPRSVEVDALGNAAMVGCGPLRFRCIEPFRHWRVTFSPHQVAALTARQLIDQSEPGAPPMRGVSFEIDYRPAVPPLVSGTMSAASASVMAGEQGRFISPRYEQLCRATGWLEIDGERRGIRGQVLRIKRQGVRRFEGFQGHCWMSAVFPSGRAFGVNVFPPREDGQPSFNEGFVFDGDGPLKPARAVEAPWLRELLVSGEHVPLVLEADGERIAIDAITFINCRSPGAAILPASFPIVQQAHARFRWDDEEATGMIERSTLRKDMTA